MGVSGCTSCQVGGAEALKAYDRAYQAKLDQKAKDAAALTQQAQQVQAPPPSENRPIPGATVGSRINIAA